MLINTTYKKASTHNLSYCINNTLFLLITIIINTVDSIKSNTEIRRQMQIPKVLQKDVCLIIKLYDVMYPGQLKHYGLLGKKCLWVIDLGDTACDPLFLNKKMYAAAFSSQGRGSRIQKGQRFVSQGNCFSKRGEKRNKIQ